MAVAKVGSKFAILFEISNIADNKSLLKLLGYENENPTPNESVSTIGFTMWHSDIGSVVQEEIGSDDWKEIENEANKKFGETKNLRKNYLHIGHCLQLAFDRKKSSRSLERVCNNIVDPDQFKVDFP